MSVTSPRTLVLARPATPARCPQWHLQRAARHLRAAMLALIQAWHTRRRYAADRALLQRMDERDLRDLGLGRGEIEHVTGTASSDTRR